jgi:CheY-like chemotaxis protein
VSVLSSGRLSDAADLVRETAPDLIILDVVLHTAAPGTISRDEYDEAVRLSPYSNALAFHRWLRKQDATAETQVLFYTARMFLADLQEELRDGCTFYVAKTCEPAELLRWVCRILDDEVVDDVFDISGRR